MQQQRGFTLIELIIVIVILGILAVTAAPKFLNFSSDARASTVQGLSGALKSANDLLFAKAVIAGKEKAVTETIALRDGGAPVPIRYGYLDTQPTLLSSFIEVLELTDGDWVYSYNNTPGTEVRLSPKGVNNVAATSTPLTNISRCYVEFTPATAPGAKPLITVDVANCN